MKRFCLWLAFVRRFRVLFMYIALIILIILLTIFFAVYGYFSDWTGFTGYSVPTISHTINNSSGSTTYSSQYVPAKTLWDWLGLFALMGTVIATGLAAIWTASAQALATKQQIEANQLQAFKEEQLATLNSYRDQISELYKSLDTSKPNDIVQKIMRVKTLTVLRELSASHKGILLRFLNELDLISVKAARIDLSNADLSKAILRELDLSNTNLQQTILTNAILEEADLSGANLKGVTGITVKELEMQAKSLKGATMPDGSIHT